jgi:hypothetical protein
MRTSPPIMSPKPAPTTRDRSGFAEAKPMEANIRPNSRSKTFGQTVDHDPKGLAGQPCDTLVWLNHVCRLQPTGNGMKGARAVIRMPSEVTTVNFFHDPRLLTLSRMTPEYAAASKQIAPANMKGEVSDGIEAGSRPSPATYIRKVPTAAKAMSAPIAITAVGRMAECWLDVS